MAVCMSLEHAASRRALNISIHEQQRLRMSLGRFIQSRLLWMLRGSRSAMVEFGRWVFWGLIYGEKAVGVGAASEGIVVLGEASEARVRGGIVRWRWRWSGARERETRRGMLMCYTAAVTDCTLHKVRLTLVTQTRRLD